MHTHNSTIPKLNQSKMTGLQAQQAGHAEWSGAGPVLPGAGEMAAPAALVRVGRSCTALPDKDYHDAKIRQFELQAAALKLSGSRTLKGCCRWPKVIKGAEGGKNVTLKRDVTTGKTHFEGLQSCGSVWICPVCGSKISERRRLELEEGVARHRAGGGGVVMINHTLRHKEDEDCYKVKSDFLKAYRNFWSYRAGVKLREDFGIVGRVRALEVTHGKNGWHPHTHTLLFTDRPLDAAEVDSLQKRAFEHWKGVLEKQGRDAIEEYGVVVSTAHRRITEYVSKFGRMPKDKGGWTETHELTKGVVKKGRDGGRTPMQLLIDYNDKGDARAGKLWCEYAAAFKGSRQLSWTKGLRDLLGLGQEKTDEEIAAEKTGDAEEVVAIFGSAAWQLILSNDIRGEVLRAAYHGQHSLMVFLRDLGIVLGVDYPGAYDDFR